MLSFPPSQFSPVLETVRPRQHVSLPSVSSRVRHLVSLRTALLGVSSDGTQTTVSVWSSVDPRPTEAASLTASLMGMSSGSLVGSRMGSVSGLTNGSVSGLTNGSTMGLTTGSTTSFATPTGPLAGSLGSTASGLAGSPPPDGPSDVRLSDISRPSDAGALNAEQFESGWESAFSPQTHGMLAPRSQGVLCNCCLGCVESVCRFGTCLLLCPMLQKPLLHVNETPASRVFCLPPTPNAESHSVLIASPSGIIESWNAANLTTTWSLNIYDTVRVLKATPFLLPLHASAKPLKSPCNSDDSGGSMRSLDLSPLPASGSLSDCLPLEYCGECLSGNGSETVEDVTMGRLIVIGTEKGRLILVDEIEGHALLDINIMDTSLDNCVLSGIFEHVWWYQEGGDNPGHRSAPGDFDHRSAPGDMKESRDLPGNDLTGFLISCINETSGIVYSLFVYWDARSHMLQSRPLPHGSGSQGSGPTRESCPVPSRLQASSEMTILPASHTSEDTTSENSNQSRVDVTSLCRSVPSAARCSLIDGYSLKSGVHTREDSFSVSSGKPLFFRDLFVGLFRAEPSALAHAKMEFIERGAIQDVRLCAWLPDSEHSMQPRYHVTSVWTLNGDVDSVTLAQMKIQEDATSPASAHTITTQEVEVATPFDSEP